MEEHERENYELFRRAILHREEAAWAAIHARYRSLLISWAYRSSARARVGECCDDIADQALARAWVALTPERFAEFPTLAKLLSYLRACVATAAIDGARAYAADERALHTLQAGSAATPEQIVMAGIDRDALWRTVIALAATPAERAVIVENLAYGLPPRAILERHPQLFADIAEVYGTKRNLFARLQRNRDLLRLRDEFVSI
jgi:hypothetical protein